MVQGMAMVMVSSQSMLGVKRRKFALSYPSSKPLLPDFGLEEFVPTLWVESERVYDISCDQSDRCDSLVCSVCQDWVPSQYSRKAQSICPRQTWTIFTRQSTLWKGERIEKTNKNQKKRSKTDKKREKDKESRAREVDINIRQKNQKQMTKLRHGHGKDCATSRPKYQKICQSSEFQNTKRSAVKPEPELKNTIGCNLYPSDGPGKPNSIFMKTVKTKWALNHLQQPICVQLTKML
ncbi:hypothetical protein Tco_0720021 [Tanacetum coccineum]